MSKNLIWRYISWGFWGAWSHPCWNPQQIDQLNWYWILEYIYGYIKTWQKNVNLNNRYYRCVFHDTSHSKLAPGPVKLLVLQVGPLKPCGSSTRKTRCYGLTRSWSSQTGFGPAKVCLWGHEIHLDLETFQIYYEQKFNMKVHFLRVLRCLKSPMLKPSINWPAKLILNPRVYLHISTNI